MRIEITSCNGIDTYVGDFVGSNPSGVHYFNGVERFVGSFKGLGIYDNGSLYQVDVHGTNSIVYKGDFLHQRRHGYGVEFDSKKSVRYQGEYWKGVFHGHGDLFEGGRLIYKGDFKCGKFDGYGTLTRMTSTFDGHFVNGSFNGDGRMYKEDNGPTLVYDGNFVNNLYQGDGVQYLPHGIRIEGNFHRHKPDGFCKIYDSKNTLIYEGGVEDGLPHGNGTLHANTSTQHITRNGTTFEFQSLCTYSGDFKRSLLHGYAVVRRDGFFIYKGDFRHDAKHGFGFLFHHDGQTVSYAGDFESNVKHGTGTEFSEQTLTTYKGSFRNDYRHGKGKTYHANGTLHYHGEFKEGKASGYGELFSCYRQKEFSGFFVHGIKEGDGCEFSPAGDVVYRGEFHKNLYHGRGKLFDRARPLYDGEFVLGARHGEGVTFTSDGEEALVVYNNGIVDLDATGRRRAVVDVRKRKRQEVVDDHTNNEHLGDVPICPLCLCHMMYDDEIYIFTPCGHSVCKCILSCSKSWHATCVICRSDASLIRRY